MEPLERNAVITPITPPDFSKSTAYYLARRLHVVFNDLGLWTPHPLGLASAESRWPFIPPSERA